PPTASVVPASHCVVRDRCLVPWFMNATPKEDTMTIVRWRSAADPFAMLERRMQRLLAEPFGAEDMGWNPSVEVTETENSIEVSAELPGVSKEDVTVDLANNVLTIRGEKKQEREEKENEHYLFERFYGSFHRGLALPSAVDERNVKADFKDGVLKVHLG